MKIEVLKCNGCGRLAVAVDEVRVTPHKCAGRWTVVLEAQYDASAILSSARREGIEMAIDHMEKSDCPIPIDRLPPGQTKRQFSNTVIEFLILELRRMAREVQLGNVQCAPGSGQEVKP